ncbi:class IIb bacteriocin, lactobin A/cerein 7B family [Abyssalbus ytuae]|uniref:Class IIb bacteriocin, lactobin A/cerein 7B family n=1 Tax=Abyssalbus ytuae TaxID=2926907 RepID=A0A9E7D3H1_9FLAO|nr:class IIb bacteriocin, lactobin A/cerein 7B family [Abyssalbus ytuae]UOB17844.1 class IIb bacteriocin, lactobin A/cerein 7B family [Abyssalbus ytuae]
MKSIENYGVQELSSKEIRNINGGIWPLIRAAVALALWHWDNWDDIKAGFERAQQ